MPPNAKAGPIATQNPLSERLSVIEAGSDHPLGGERGWAERVCASPRVHALSRWL